MEGIKSGSMFNDWIHTREITLLSCSDSHHSVSFLTSQTIENCKYFCLSQSKNIMRCHSLPPSLSFVTNPGNPFMTDGWWLDVPWSLDLGWMGQECHNSNGIFTIKIYMTKLAPRHKNSSQSHAADNWLSARMQKQFCALWILYREMNYCRDFPIRWNENWTKHNNRYFLKLVLHGWWLWGPAYFVLEDRGGGS